MWWLTWETALNRLGMSLTREVDIAANERRGAIVGLLYEIDRPGWLLCRSRSRLRD